MSESRDLQTALSLKLLQYTSYPGILAFKSDFSAKKARKTFPILSCTGLAFDYGFKSIFASRKESTGKTYMIPRLMGNPESIMLMCMQCGRIKSLPNFEVIGNIVTDLSLNNEHMCPAICKECYETRRNAEYPDYVFFANEQELYDLFSIFSKGVLREMHKLSETNRFYSSGVYVNYTGAGSGLSGPLHLMAYVYTNASPGRIHSIVYNGIVIVVEYDPLHNFIRKALLRKEGVAFELHRPNYNYWSYLDDFSSYERRLYLYGKSSQGTKKFVAAALADYKAFEKLRKMLDYLAVDVESFLIDLLPEDAVNGIQLMPSSGPRKVQSGTRSLVISAHVSQPNQNLVITRVTGYAGKIEDNDILKRGVKLKNPTDELAIEAYPSLYAGTILYKSFYYDYFDKPVFILPVSPDEYLSIVMSKKE